jgi:hypothetical protein
VLCADLAFSCRFKTIDSIPLDYYHAFACVRGNTSSRQLFNEKKHANACKHPRAGENYTHNRCITTGCSLFFSRWINVASIHTGEILLRKEPKETSEY